MSEKVGAVDKKILELLRYARSAAEQQAADVAHGLYQETAAEVQAVTLEGMFATSVLDLGARMLKQRSRVRLYKGKELDRRADQIASQNPSLNKQAARQLLKHVRKMPNINVTTASHWKVQTAPLYATSLEGIEGEKVSQSWFVELDAQPMPPGRFTRMDIFLSARTETGQEETVPIYKISARETDGAFQLLVEEDDRPLEGSDLYTPYGFVLEAASHYPPAK